MFRKTFVLALAVSIFSFAAGAFAVAYVNFRDVPPGYWAESAINWAGSMGIMNGPDDNLGTFDPAGNVNRAQLATVSERLYKTLDGRIQALESRVDALEGNGNVIDNSAYLDIPLGTTVEKFVAVDKLKDHILGDLSAPVTVVEYSDFECPFCKSHHPTLHQLLTDNGVKVNWVYRHFPLSFHEPLASRKAVASECAAELGGNVKFWEFADALFAGDVSTDASLLTIARNLGLNQAVFQTCLNSGKYDALITKSIDDGNAAGVNGTPANIVVNNKTGEAVMIGGAVPVSNLQKVIDGFLAQ